MSGAGSKHEFLAMWDIYGGRLKAAHVDALEDSEASRRKGNQAVWTFFQGTYVFRNDLSKWYFGAFQRIYPHLGVWINRTNNPCESFNHMMKGALVNGASGTESKFGFFIKSQFLPALLCKLEASLGPELRGDANDFKNSVKMSDRQWAASQVWVDRITRQLRSSGVQSFADSKGVGVDGRCFLLDFSGVLRPISETIDHAVFHAHVANYAYRVSFCDMEGFRGRAGAADIPGWRFGRCSCSNWWTRRCCEHVLAVYRICCNSQAGVPKVPVIAKLVKQSEAEAENRFIRQAKKAFAANRCVMQKRSSSDLAGWVTELFEDPNFDGDLAEDPLKPDSQAQYLLAERERALLLGCEPELLDDWRRHFSTFAQMLKAADTDIDAAKKYLEQFIPLIPSTESVELTSALHRLLSERCYPVLKPGRKPRLKPKGKRFVAGGDQAINRLMNTRPGGVAGPQQPLIADPPQDPPQPEGELEEAGSVISDQSYLYGEALDELELPDEDIDTQLFALKSQLATWIIETAAARNDTQLSMRVLDMLNLDRGALVEHSVLVERSCEDLMAFKSDMEMEIALLDYADALRMSIQKRQAQIRANVAAADPVLRTFKTDAELSVMNRSRLETTVTELLVAKQHITNVNSIKDVRVEPDTPLKRRHVLTAQLSDWPIPAKRPRRQKRKE
jgi:hypothetical protein